MVETNPNELVARPVLISTPIVPAGQAPGDTKLWLQFFEEAPRWEVWLVEMIEESREALGILPGLVIGPESPQTYVQAIASGDEPADLADDYLDWVDALDPAIQAEMANHAQLILQMAEAQDV